MVLGKRPDPLDQLTPTPGGRLFRGEPSVYVPPTNRHRLGSAGQHLRVGRLHRLARREVRQERPVRQGRGHARQRAPSSARRTASRSTRRAWSMWPIAATPIVVLDNDLNRKAIYDHVGAPWAVCISPDRTIPLQLQLVPDRQQHRSGAGDRRDLQDGAGRHGARPIRQGRTRLEGIQQRPPDRLPESGRGLRRRNHRLAYAEIILRRRRQTRRTTRRPHEAPFKFFSQHGVVRGAALFAQSVPEINYDANSDFILLPPYGEVAGVATNSEGNVFVYARRDTPSRPSATSAPSITAARACFSSISRQVREGDRPGHLRPHFRPAGTSRPPGQRLVVDAGSNRS